MMHLPSQTAFSDLIALKMRGGSAVIDAPYKELYRECETQNSANWYMLSAEDRTGKFVDFVEEERKTRVDNLIQKQTLSGAEKDALHKLNLKGQVLLASVDGGQTFDQLLTKDNLPVSTAGLTLLSPSLRSATTDYHEVINEQAMQNKVTELESQGYLVKNPPRIELDRIIVEIIDPKAGEAEVQFDADSLELIEPGPAEAKGTYESQLPEEYGQAETDPTLKPVTEEEILRAAMSQGANSGDKNKKIAALSAGAAFGVSNLLGRKKMGAAIAADRALRDMKKTRAAMQFPLSPRLGGESGQSAVTNTAAKAAMAARAENNRKKIKESQDNDAKREAKYKEDQREKDNQDRKLAIQRKQMASSGGGTSSGGMGGTAVGIGIGAAAAAAGFTGTSLYIALQNSLT